MPCSDGGPSPEQVAIDNATESLKKARRVNKSLSVMLCSACRALDNRGFDFSTNPRLDEWWDEHKKADQTREKKEAKIRLQEERAAELAKKPFGELDADDRRFLKKMGYI